MTRVFDVPEDQLDIIADTIIVTGSPRSGTSIFGQLISTFRSIEYNYEPQIVPVLLRLIASGDIAKSAAFMLLRMHLHEDLLLESAHGRRANLRPDDMSLVLKSISWKELLTRWTTIADTADAKKYIRDSGLRLAIKTVSVAEFIPLLREALPRAQFAIVVRDGRDVIASLLQKKWLTDEALQTHYWPHKHIVGKRVPDRIPDDMAERWLGMNPETRACYLWCNDADTSLALMDRQRSDHVAFVNYEELVTHPEPTLTVLAEFFGSELTEQTNAMVRTLRPYRARTDFGFLDAIDADQRVRFERLQKMLGYV